MTKSKTYDNGLKIIVKQMDGLLSVTTGILVNTGSVNELDDNNGISHFIEHMLFKGTKTRTSFEISDGIDRIGANINAFTGKETTCYYTKSTTEHTQEAIEILSDLFFNSTFPKEELDNERGVIIEEINMCEDSPEDVCSDLLATAVFGDEGFGRTILGSKENVMKFGKSDIEDYMSKYYTPDNIVVSFAGNISFEQAEEVIDKYFLPNFSSGRSAEKYVFEKSYTNFLVKSKEIEQTHIGISMPGINYADPRGNAISILNTVFGGGMSSRLFQKIREQLGLAYSVYSYVQANLTCGNICIFAAVNPSKYEAAYSAIIDEIKLFAENGIDENEFSRGKEQIKGAFIMSQESTSSQMLLYGKYLMVMNDIFDFEKKLSDINAITLNEVNALAKEFFTADKISAAVVSRDAKPL